MTIRVKAEKEEKEVTQMERIIKKEI